MAENAKDRVYAAAEHINAERTPTVSAVREAAAVSMADASRYLKQWKQEQATATAAVVAAPGAVTDQAAKLAGTLWAEAVKLAGEDHKAVQAVWEAEKAELSAEVDELVTAADATEAAHRKETEAAAQGLTTAEERAAAAERRAETAQQATTEAEAENGRLREQLAAADATEAAHRKETEAAVKAVAAAEERAAAAERRADAAQQANAEREAAAAKATAAAEERAAAAEERAEAAAQANAEREAESGRLREQLAAAQSAATAVQTAMDAVLARIGAGDDGGGTPPMPQK